VGAETVLPTPPAAVAARPEGGSLTRRASLTAIGSMLDYAAKILVYLVVTPILVTGLGRTVYGIWEMLARLGGFMTVTDGRPTEALRLIIAQKQDEPDDNAKRRVVGAAMAVWLLMLPLTLVVGGVLAWWLAPMLIQPGPGLLGDVRLTFGILVVSFLVTSLGLIPESVLRGMNLGYRRMGLQAGLNLLGGALAAGAIWQGLGLVGLGSAQAIRAAITGLCFWLLVRRFVAWWGAERPARVEVRALFGMSLWLMLGDALAKILLASDVLILGAVIAPAAVTTYALTGYAARTAVGIHVFAAGAAIPGLGGLLGRAELARAAAVRRELLLLTWLFVTVVGSTILLWNRTFIGMWIGPVNYAGTGIDLLVVLVAVQTAFVRTDAYIIDATLRPKARVLFSAVSAAALIALGLPLTHLFGLPGLCVGILAARGIQSVAYPMLVRKALGPQEPRGTALTGVRLAVLSGLLFATAALLSRRLEPAGWVEWSIGVALTLPLVAGTALLLGPDADSRRILFGRIRGILRIGRGS
jgi:O-antigen/teichoic acid export membrane protein